MTARIFLSPPHLSGRETAYVEEAFASNYVAPVGPMLDAFEREFAGYTGIPHCVALSSCTAAVHLALRLAGVGDGDTVLASSFTFIGSIAPILYLNATPVFIDSDESSWTMEPDLLADALKTAAKNKALPKAVLPTDIYGQSCDLNRIKAICVPYNIPVITDSAEAVGAMYQGKHAGDGALMATYSFNGNKVITTSGGGMLASHDASLIEKAKFLSQQARDPAPHYEHSTYGYNYRMSNILAAIGRAQLTVVKERVTRRREIFEAYYKALHHLPGIRFMPEAAYGKSSRWLTTLLVDAKLFGAAPEKIRQALEAENIEARPVWKPMHLQPVFKKYNAVGGAVCERMFAQGLCLPSGTQLTSDDLARICGIITSLHKK